MAHEYFIVERRSCWVDFAYQMIRRIPFRNQASFLRIHMIWKNERYFQQQTVLWLIRRNNRMID